MHNCTVCDIITPMCTKVPSHAWVHNTYLWMGSSRLLFVVKRIVWASLLEYEYAVNAKLALLKPRKSFRFTKLPAVLAIYNCVSQAHFWLALAPPFDMEPETMSD